MLDTFTIRNGDFAELWRELLATIAQKYLIIRQEYHDVTRLAVFELRGIFVPSS